MNLLAIAILAAAFTRPMERVSSLDPARCQSIYDSHAVMLLYETPLAIDYEARPYKLVPGVCDLPEISQDGHRYRFRVRKGGRARAEDVVRALERLRSPDIVSPNSWMVGDVDTITATDDFTVDIALKRRVRYFPWLMAMAPCAVVLKDGSGTGAYKLKFWRRNHEMVFTRRADLPGGFDTIRYLVIDDASTQWLMFLKGEVDFLGAISRDNWDSVVGPDGRLDSSLEKRGVRLFSMPTLESMYIGINMRDPVLGPNKKLRQALNCAFDFPAWDKFYNHRVSECDGPVPPGVPERLETPFQYRFDLAKAERLMAEAGYPGGVDPKTGRRLELVLSIGRASQESREAGELTAAFYEKIGIRLKLDFMTWDAFLTAVNEKRVQMFRMGWVGDYPDAQNFLQLFYGPNRSPGVNHVNFENAAYDAAYEREDFATCQEIVREECPWVFTHFNMAYSLAGPNVNNYIPSDFPYGNERFYTP